MWLDYYPSPLNYSPGLAAPSQTHPIQLRCSKVTRIDLFLPHVNQWPLPHRPIHTNCTHICSLRYQFSFSAPLVFLSPHASFLTFYSAFVTPHPIIYTLCPPPCQSHHMHHGLVIFFLFTSPPRNSFPLHAALPCRLKTTSTFNPTRFPQANFPHAALWLLPNHVRIRVHPFRRCYPTPPMLPQPRPCYPTPPMLTHPRPCYPTPPLLTHPRP